jgi:hypothetical protein
MSGVAHLHTGLRSPSAVAMTAVWLFSGGGPRRWQARFLAPIVSVFTGGV